MKYIYFILVLIVVSACTRKQDEVELTSSQILVTYPSQCYNNMQDSNELGVDCGGPCQSCNVVTPNCSPTSNTITVGSSNYTTSISSCGVNGSNVYEVLGSYSSGTISIEFNTNTISQAIEYDIVSSAFAQNEVAITVNSSGYGNLLLSTGKLYVSQSGGSYVFTICNSSGYSWVTSQTISVTAKVTCP